LDNSLLTTRKTIWLLDEEGRPVLSVPYQPGYNDYPQIQISFLEPTNALAAAYAIWFRPVNPKMPERVLWLGPGQTVVKSADLPLLDLPQNRSWTDDLAIAMEPPATYLVKGGFGRSAWNILGCILSLIGAGIGWALLRRYETSTKAVAGWTVFIFLLGIPGLLTLLCVQEWPAREACPHCKKLRAVDRELCEHCGSPFSPPERNGTEIFAPLAKAE
jgi:hypothetical protein